MNETKNNDKRVYVAPMIMCETIVLEGGISASSATIIPGGSADTFSPNVEEWQSEIQENDILF
ncbi:hypothetical protein [Sphingobacterium deserti]|uniref:Uncharacterized protein n=1 Tax=Sphingobacterium deserti TaxID=1229276 RepID=A0A0B8T2D7_9SPHI|nr:hypothetical protein [Sphingobacterium deserti]KGE15041.1 hypothetical protein DI53_1268 [Sphingobacterium deserti]